MASVVYRCMGGLLLLLLFSACAGVSRLDKGPLVAYGEHRQKGQEQRYYLVRINVENEEDSPVLQALVKLTPEAPPVAIRDLTPDFVALHLPRFEPPPQWPAQWKEKARKDHAYSGNGFHIHYTPEGRLGFIGLCSNCYPRRESPEVGTPDGTRFFTLPLTLPEFMEVFGPPDKSRTQREVYSD
jgi:hypothetical protein